MKHEVIASVTRGHHWTFLVFDRSFPNSCAWGPLLPSRNNHGSSHPSSRKFRVTWWEASKIRYLYLRTDFR